MKTPSLILFITLIFFNYGCQKSDVCGKKEHIFDISQETKEWLPDEILDDKLVFQSENGESLTLRKDTVYHLEHDWSFSNPCGDRTQRETIFYERITHAYTSGDTVNIALSTNIVNTECGWSGVKEVKLMEEVRVYVEKRRLDPSELVPIGLLSIRTKLINAEETEEFCTKHHAKYNDQLEINGITYEGVHSDASTGPGNAQFPLSDIYFQKGQGIIGFVDETGLSWRRID